MFNYKTEDLARLLELARGKTNMQCARNARITYVHNMYVHVHALRLVRGELCARSQERIVNFMTADKRKPIRKKELPWLPACPVGVPVPYSNAYAFTGQLSGRSVGRTPLVCT